MPGRRKAIQLSVLLLAGFAVVCAVRAVLHDPYGLDARTRYICVATGMFFNLSAEEAGMVPATNPRTAEPTLLPCALGDDGRTHVGERYRPALVEQLAEVNRHVDPVTLAVH